MKVIVYLKNIYNKYININKIYMNINFIKINFIKIKNLFKDPINYIYLFFPLFTAYLTIAICPMKKNSGIYIKFRPPSYIFAIVWPILYLLLGLAWVISKKNSIIYLILSLLLCYWLVVYSCQKNKNTALVVLLLSILLTLICYTVSKKISQLLLLPLIVWLNFAVLLSIFDM